MPERYRLRMARHASMHRWWPATQLVRAVELTVSENLEGRLEHLHAPLINYKFAHFVRAAERCPRQPISWSAKLLAQKPAESTT